MTENQSTERKEVTGLRLKRRLGQIVDIRVGETLIRVQYTKHKGRDISLAFEAPEYVEITREEAQDKAKERLDRTKLSQACVDEISASSKELRDFFHDTACGAIYELYSKGKKIQTLEAQLFEATLSTGCEGIEARVVMYSTPASKEFYQDLKDVGGLHGHYLGDVRALLIELRRTQRELATLKSALGVISVEEKEVPAPSSNPPGETL